MIPDLVRERGILDAGGPVYWSYESVVGCAVVSSRKLEKSDYESVGYRKILEDGNGLSCVIPAKFFEDFQGQGSPKVAEPVPDHARFEPKERVHFMFRDDMASADPSSCYVFTDEEFNERFADSDVWEGALDDVPRFS